VQTHLDLLSVQYLESFYKYAKQSTQVLAPRACMPINKDEMRHKVAEFESNFGMPQSFGCIDGTYIPLKRPSENSHDFYNYKGYFSQDVQAVCD